MKNIYFKEVAAKYGCNLVIRGDHPDGIMPGISIDLGATALVLSYEGAKDLSNALAEAYSAMEQACEDCS